MSFSGSFLEDCTQQRCPIETSNSLHRKGQIIRTARLLLKKSLSLWYSVTHRTTRSSNHQKSPPPILIHIKRRPHIPKQGERCPARIQQQRHTSLKPQTRINQHTIVGHDEDPQELIPPHHDGSDQRSLLVWSTPEDLKWAGRELLVEFELLFHEVEFLTGYGMVWIVWCCVEALNDFEGFLSAILGKEPTRGEGDEGGSCQNDQGWDTLECEWETPGESCVGGG